MTTKPTKEEPAKDTIDWKHATVRQNCLNEAVKTNVPYDKLINLANEMYRFVIGEPITQIEPKPETQKEGWK